MASQLGRFDRTQSLASTGNSLVFGRTAHSHRERSSTPQEQDPLQPLRAMADRVGKEVEKFAERLDHWHAHGNETAQSKYQTTLRLVDKFKDVAENTIKELKKQNHSEHDVELVKSVRRRIQHMADSPRPSIENDDSRSTRSIAPSEPTPESVKELKHWQGEAATWDLVRVIIELYHPEPGADPEAEKKVHLDSLEKIHRYTSNHVIWQRFLLEDDQAKEKFTILKWLERTAANTESDIQSITRLLEAESGKETSNWTMGWLDTKFKLKQEKRLRGLTGPLPVGVPSIQSRDRTQLLVNQLDPDAPARQSKALEKSDDYYERALWMACYEMLRRGTEWGKIAEWCKEKNEAWRGVSIGGAFEDQPQDVPNLSGPTAGYLWRRMCFYQARGARYNYEAALYGLLSGDLKSVEAVCRSWDDHLYARYNALLLSRFDGYLQKNFPQRVSPTLTRKFVFQDATSSLGSWENSTVQTVEGLKQQKSSAAQASTPLKLIQASLITGKMQELLVNVGAALSSLLSKDERHVKLIINPNEDTIEGKSAAPITLAPETENQCSNLAADPHALRIAVHLLIILRNGLGIIKPEQASEFAAVDNVIAAYIEHFRMNRKMMSIPLYASQLYGYRQFHCLGRILPDIRHPAEQKQFADVLQSYNLDTVDAIGEYYDTVLKASGLMNGQIKPIDRYEILEKTAQDEWLWPGQRVNRKFLDEAVSDKDQAVLDCLQWYKHLPRARSSFFINLTDAMKHFLLRGRMGAALKLAKEMSVETISYQKTPAYCGYAFDFTLPGSEEQDTASYGHAQDQEKRSKRVQITPEQHAHEVQVFRQTSQSYYEMQQLVTLIELFSQWAEEEEELIAARNTGAKPPTKRAKDLFEQIDTFTSSLLSSFLTTSSEGTPFSTLPSLPPSPEKSRILHEYNEFRAITAAYIPEIVLAYVSVVHAAAFFFNRDLVTKAMEIANLVADEGAGWLRAAFLEGGVGGREGSGERVGNGGGREGSESGNGRMRELVTCLANVSKGMLRLGELGGKKEGGRRKRGWGGESLRVWDVNVRN